MKDCAKANNRIDPQFNSISDAALLALADDIKRWGRELGFQQVGITDTELGQHSDHLHRWLEKHHHGEMAYMAEREQWGQTRTAYNPRVDALSAGVTRKQGWFLKRRENLCSPRAIVR
mgnify:CR=1 FL=1